MEQTDVIKYWKGGGENLPVPYTLFALSPVKQSPRIVAIILIAAAEKQIATQNWSPCIESVPRFESRAVNWNPSDGFSWIEKKK